MLTLKRASKHRPAARSQTTIYDVFEGERHIGRFLWTYAALHNIRPSAAALQLITRGVSLDRY